MVRLTRDESNPVIRQVDTGQLSRRGTRIALTFIFLGLLTFLLPIVKFDPPAHGRQYWSDLNIALQLWSRFNTEDPLAMFLLVPFGLVYLLLLIALAAVVLFPRRKALRWIGLAGLFLLYPFRGVFGGIRLAAFFESGRGGDLRTLWVLFGFMMLAVTLVTWTDTTT